MFRSTRPRRAGRRCTCFDPRAREGRDLSRVLRSLHVSSFDPRAREGRDSSVKPMSSANTEFRSTRPRRARRLLQSARRALESFDPRAREGRDASRGPASAAARVSIHAPAKGATLFCDGRHLRRDVSIHAPAKGATGGHYFHLASERFRSTRPRRARPTREAAELEHERFRSTRPRRARRCDRAHVPSLRGFDPRAREGRDTHS